jgi:hypothetical protein
MPFKVFAVNEILTAANVNTYFAQQVVSTFAGTAERGSAIGTPVAGQFAFLTDTNTLTFYNAGGTAWEEFTSGGGSDPSGAILLNTNEITENYTFEDNYNGVSAGPVTIASGATVTVGTASSWSVV